MAEILFPKQQQFSRYSSKGVPRRIIQSQNVSRDLKKPKLQDFTRPSSIDISSDEDEEDRVEKQMEPIAPAEKRGASSRKRKLGVDSDFLESAMMVKQQRSDRKRRKSAAPVDSWTSSGDEARINHQGRSTDSASSSSRTQSSGRAGRVLVRKHLNGRKKKSNQVENSDSDSSDCEEEMILVKMKEQRMSRSSRTAVKVEREVKDSGEKKSCLVSDFYISKAAPAASPMSTPSTKKAGTRGGSRCKPVNSKVNSLGLLLSISLLGRIVD